MALPDTEALIAAALAARERAYAPYSKFTVGAALLTESGKIYCGCNVENLSFGLTNCAERTAVFSAVADGQQSFKQIAIVSDSLEPISPCGACRQVLAEFAPAMQVIAVNLKGDRFETTLKELLPRAKTGILDQCST